jgi:hypothetical protein
MRTNALIMPFLILTMTGCVSAEAQSPKDLNRGVDELSSLLQSRQITRIEILHVPDNLQTRTRITPEMLRTISKTKVVVDSPWESSSFKGLLASLRELKNAESHESGEVRWAILFSDATGKGISAIYLSLDGSLGIFQGNWGTSRVWPASDLTGHSRIGPCWLSNNWAQ